MSPLEFCYWLRGSIELGKKNFNEKETKIIEDHLNLALQNREYDLKDNQIKDDGIFDMKLLNGYLNGVICRDEFGNKIFKETPTKEVKFDTKWKKQVC